jgi:Zn-dependent protease with chaperone function
MMPGPEISVLAGDRDLLGNRFRYICVGTLLLAAADTKNLECYLGHELGHLLSELENKPRHRAIVHKIYDPLLKLLIQRFDLVARAWSFYTEKRTPLRRIKRYAFEYFADRAAHAVVGAEEFEESFEQLSKMNDLLRSLHLKELTHRELSKQNLLREEFQAMIPALLAEADQQAKEAAARQKETHPSTEARIAAVWRREGRTR